MKLHKLLLRQLKRIGISDPENHELTREQWSQLLNNVSNAYNQSDEYRYTISRSMDVSSEEMQGLYKKLSYEKKKIESIMSDGLCIVDNNLRIESINEKALQILQCKEEEVVGRNLQDIIIIYDTSSANTPISLDQLKLDKPFSYDLFSLDFAMLRTAKADQVPISISINSLAEGSKPRGALIIIRDMYERTLADKKLNAAVKALEISQQKHKHLAYFDTLTNLSNRAMFDMELKKIITSHELFDTQFAILYIDVDNFKTINNNFGRNVGDLFLCSVADRLKTCLRKTDFLSRFSGDEFAIILQELESPKIAGDKANKILEIMAEPFKLKEAPVNVSVSIGVASYPQAGKDAATLLKHAEMAMFYAKKQGGGKFQFFTSKLDSYYKNYYQIDLALQKAIANNEFQLNYQPIYNLKTGEIVAFETLLRWDSGEFGRVENDKFIQVAEESGIIIPIGSWVLNNALKNFKEWLTEFNEAFRLTINVSTYQLLHSDFAQLLIHSVDELGIRHDLIELELMETAIRVPAEKLEAVVNQLALLNFRISIDDFGMGYSSIAHIQRLPVTCIKIDKFFISHSAENQRDTLIVKSLINLAKNLNLNIIAEGVETDEQVQLLKQYGCLEGQGYYFYKPAEASQIRQLLTTIHTKSNKK